MQIRQKLTYQFLSIVALIMLISLLSIYYFSSDYRKDGFYSRLHNKASNTARLLLEVDEVDETLLKRIEQNNPISLPEEKIRIYNNKGELIYNTDEKGDLFIDQKLIDKVRHEKNIYFEQKHYEVLGFLFTDQRDEFVVIAAANDLYGLKKMTNLRTILIVVFCISMLLVFLSGWVYAGKALYPISKVIDQVGDIGISNLNSRVDEGNKKDEIAKLASTFNHMLDRLESAFSMQKNFIANASHELRTPLAGIGGQLEVLLMHPRKPEEYVQVLHSVLADMKNLNNLSNRLLLLAQASSETSKVHFEEVRLDELVWETRSELLRHNPEYTIYVNIDPDIDDHRKMTAKGNTQLLKTVLVNLMDNGCKYSNDHSVSIRIRFKAKLLQIDFEDNGIGIDKEDMLAIFEPFHRAKNTLTYKGHGIGLSLVERIMALHHGNVVVKSEPKHGSVFSIRFPVKYPN